MIYRYVKVDNQGCPIRRQIKKNTCHPCTKFAEYAYYTTAMCTTDNFCLKMRK